MKFELGQAGVPLIVFILGAYLMLIVEYHNGLSEKGVANELACILRYFYNLIPTSVKEIFVGFFSMVTPVYLLHTPWYRVCYYTLYLLGATDRDTAPIFMIYLGGSLTIAASTFVLFVFLAISRYVGARILQKYHEFHKS